MRAAVHQAGLIATEMDRQLWEAAAEAGMDMTELRAIVLASCEAVMRSWHTTRDQACPSTSAAPHQRPASSPPREKPCHGDASGPRAAPAERAVAGRVDGIRESSGSGQPAGSHRGVPTGSNTLRQGMLPKPAPAVPQPLPSHQRSAVLGSASPPTQPLHWRMLPPAELPSPIAQARLGTEAGKAATPLVPRSAGAAGVAGPSVPKAPSPAPSLVAFSAVVPQSRAQPRAQSSAQPRAQPTAQQLNASILDAQRMLPVQASVPATASDWQLPPTALVAKSAQRSARGDGSAVMIEVSILRSSLPQPHCYHWYHILRCAWSCMSGYSLSMQNIVIWKQILRALQITPAKPIMIRLRAIQEACAAGGSS